MSSNGTGGMRSGYELGNSSVRRSLGAVPTRARDRDTRVLANALYAAHVSGAIDLKGSISATAKTEASSQTKQTQMATEKKVDEQFGQGTSSTAKKGVAIMQAVLDISPVNERYSGAYWTPGSSDVELANLRETLNRAATVGEETRAMREKEYRDWVQGVAVYTGPFGLALWAMAEGFLYIANKLSDNQDSEEHRAEALAAVKELWDRWRMLAPTYQGDFTGARQYAGLVRDQIKLLDASEEGEPWRTDWVATVDRALAAKSPAMADAANMGWFPFSYSDWTLTGLGPVRSHDNTFTVRNVGSDRIWFGQSRVTTIKPGWFSAARETTRETHRVPYDYYVRETSRYAAGIGVMVAVALGRVIEPVVEAAYYHNRAVLAEIGPDPDLQIWRLKDVFRAAKLAAEAAPPMPMRVQRPTSTMSTALSRLSTLGVRTLSAKSVTMIDEAQKRLRGELEADRKLSLEMRGLKTLARLHQLRRLSGIAGLVSPIRK